MIGKFLYIGRYFEELMEDIGKIVIMPVVLIIVLYIAYVLVSSLSEITPGFGNIGWYVFGAIVSAVVIFISFAWLESR